MIDGRQSRPRVGFDPERGVAHAEWLQDPSDHKTIEALSRSHFDDAPKDRGRFAVAETRAWILEQRRFGDVDDELRQGNRSRPDLQSAIQLRGAMAEAGGVQEQILDGDLAGRLAWRPAAAFLDHDLLELGQEFRNGIGEAQLVLVSQHHDPDRGDSLGH